MGNIVCERILNNMKGYKAMTNLRKDYRGWTIKVPFMPYRIEYVSFHHLPDVIAIERSLTRHTIKRFEIGLLH